METMKSEHFKTMLVKLAILFCFHLAAASKDAFGQSATIHVRIINGRTGHPISAMNFAFVDYHTDETGKYRDDLNGRKTVTTSIEDDSYIANPDAHGVLVFNGLNSMWTVCSKQKFYDDKTHKYGADYPVSTITTSGLVARNDCSKQTAKAKPGELVIFIRPTTWWERFVWGMKS